MSGMSGGGSIIIAGNTGSVMGHSLTLVGSGGLTVAASGTTLTISDGSSSGVTSLNSLTGALSITAGNNITITPLGLNIAVAVTGTTNHTVQIGNVGGSLSSLAVGLNGQTIMGSTAADPGWTSSPQFGGSVTATNDITSTAGSINSLSGSIITRDATNTATGPSEYFQKSRVANPITSGDSLGVQRFTGYDGTGFITGAKIISTNSGTVATNRIAGNLQFYTHPDSVIALPSEPLLRMTIDPTGAVTIAAPDSGTGLTVSGGGVTITGSLTDLTSYTDTLGATANVTLIDSTGKFGGLAGTAGQVLQGGTAPSFSTTTYPSTTAIGDVLIATAANVITAVTGASTAGWVLTANGAATSPTFQAPAAGGMTFSANNNGSITLAVSTGYILTLGTLQTCTLPATAAVGSIIALVGQGAGLWKVAQNANQYINIGGSVSTTGVTGYIASTIANDCVELICVVANNGWTARSVMGNLTIA